MPAAISANTPRSPRPRQPRGERREQQPAGDLRDADQADREGGEAALCPRSSRNGIASTIIAIAGERGEEERDREQPERRRAQRLAGAPPDAGARLGGVGAGAGRSTSACSGTVIDGEDDGEDDERVAPAVGVDQRLESGRKMKLASAATSVIAVIARRRSARSGKCLASTVNAGS